MAGRLQERLKNDGRLSIHRLTRGLGKPASTRRISGDVADISSPSPLIRIRAVSRAAPVRLHRRQELGRVLHGSGGHRRARHLPAASPGEPAPARARARGSPRPCSRGSRRWWSATWSAARCSSWRPMRASCRSARRHSGWLSGRTHSPRCQASGFDADTRNAHVIGL
jgi:hypothetical protein